MPRKKEIDMLEQREKATLATDTRVGILYNLPGKRAKGEQIDYVAEVEVEEEAAAVREALEKLGLRPRFLPLKHSAENLVKVIRSLRLDVIVNLCEGAFGESHLEMHVPSLLELLMIPYTGSSPLTLGLCQNKGLTKDILKANGIPTPKYAVLSSPKEWKCELEFPLFVKPLKEDASVGISKKSYVTRESELEAQVEYITQQYRQPALVEEYVAGREINVAVMGNVKPKALPISEILFEFQDEPKIVDYPAKWFKETDEYRKTKPVCPAHLKPSVKSKVEKRSLEAYEALGCRDYARIDMRLKADIPYVLEVNPNPDISPDAGFARALKAAGIPYEEFVRTIILYALERGA